VFSFFPFGFPRLLYSIVLYSWFRLYLAAGNKRGPFEKPVSPLFLFAPSSLLAKKKKPEVLLTKAFSEQQQQCCFSVVFSI